MGAEQITLAVTGTLAWPAAAGILAWLYRPGWVEKVAAKERRKQARKQARRQAAAWRELRQAIRSAAATTSADPSP